MFVPEGRWEGIRLTDFEEINNKVILSVEVWEAWAQDPSNCEKNRAAKDALNEAMESVYQTNPDRNQWPGVETFEGRLHNKLYRWLMGLECDVDRGAVSPCRQPLDLVDLHRHLITQPFEYKGSDFN